MYLGLASVSDAYEKQASDASEHYARNAQKEIRDRCLRAAPRNASDCVRQAQNAAREQQRGEQDLAAQKVMAWWTKVMGVAALIGMTLSAAGVWLVYTTFHETREANVIAKRSIRPWLIVDEIDFGPVEYSIMGFPDGSRSPVLFIRSTIKVRNVGNRPTSHFIINAKPISADIDAYTSFRNDPTAKCVTIDCLSPNETRQEYIVQWKRCSELGLPATILFGVWVLYRSSFDSDEVFETRQLWELGTPTEKDGPIAFQGDSLPLGHAIPIQFKLQRTIKMS